MQMRIAARYAVALVLGLACVFAFFLYNFPWRPSGVPIFVFMAAVAAALVLPCRLQGPLSLGVLVTYCVPVTIVTLALSSAKGFTWATVEPIAAACGGALACWMLSAGLDRIASVKRRSRVQHEQEI